jgi:hypothetical protein
VRCVAALACFGFVGHGARSRLLGDERVSTWRARRERMAPGSAPLASGLGIEAGAASDVGLQPASATRHQRRELAESPHDVGVAAACTLARIGTRALPDRQ